MTKRPNDQTTISIEDLKSHRIPIAILGLGYVGLPLAVEFARKFRVIGFDINVERVAELRNGRDSTREVTPEELAGVKCLEITSDPDDLAEAGIYIVTVPTPIDTSKRPDLGPLLGASRTVGRYLAPGNIVIYESTVYPGCTEEDCVPILQAESGLEYQSTSQPANQPTSQPANHFFAGYSPERINPGDRKHRLTDIVKVTSGSTPEVAELVDQLYASIITAGTHKTSSIQVAEAAKVIENTQRDLNIALVNELAVLFSRMGIDTTSVLAAANTKWNFLPFQPGLVGGHCIGVDPYYLTHKAQSIGHHPAVILAGRRVNDAMGEFVAGQVLKEMARAGIYKPGARVLVLGLTFKENCPDLRNTRVIDLINALKTYNMEIDIHDPWVDPDQASREYGLTMTPNPQPDTYAAVIHAVAHREFSQQGTAETRTGIRDYLLPDGIVYDIKSTLPLELVDKRL